MSKEKKIVRHFALSDETECGIYITGDTFYTQKDMLAHNQYSSKPVQHTSEKDFVTCKKCLNSKKFKATGQ